MIPQITLTGCNGSHWLISGGDESSLPVFLAPGHDLLDDVVAEARYQTTATKPGASFAGLTWEMSRRVCAFEVWSHGTTPWQRVEGNFRRAFDYEKPSTITVEAGGSLRSLDVVLAEAPTVAGHKGKAPHLYEYGRATYTLATPEPFWYTQPYIKTVQAPAGASTLTGFLLSNGGDVNTHPVWILKGPGTFTLPTFTESGEVGPGFTPPPVLPGETVIVDTDPYQEMLVSTLRPNYWALNRGKQFPCAHIPVDTHRDSAPVAVTGAATSTQVTLRVTEKFTRPWSA